MRILFVLECANQSTNGTTASCLRFAKELEKKGHEITIIGCDRIIGEKYHRYFGLPKYKFPLADKAIVKDGFIMCKMIYKTLEEAIEGQDVVHTFLPFKLSNVCRLLAQERGIAVTTAFHIVPQNCTAAIHLGWSKLINGTVLYFFKRYLYNQVRYVHCPSKMAAEVLKKHQAKYCVPRIISNGVTPFFKKLNNVKKPSQFADKFIVCMSGRLADEKRQDLIIKAVARSKYNDKIQVILCGQGPNHDIYLRLAKRKKLANPLQIKFCSHEELRETMNYIDLYIHASDYEIEGISCMEAITCGAVPLISNHRLCATKDFAIDEKCLFKHGSSKDLAKKIEYFYDHPEEVARLKKAYEEESKKYEVSLQVDALEQMFIDAYNETKEKKDLPHQRPRRKDKVLYKRYMRAAKKQAKHPEKYQK